MLEHAYHLCLQHELISNRLKALSEVKLPLVYKELNVKDAYRIDLLVEDSVIIEIKAVEQISHIHRVQLLTYLRLSKKPLGLLFNFNVKSLKHGINRIIN